MSELEENVLLLEKDVSSLTEVFPEAAWIADLHQAPDRANERNGQSCPRCPRQAGPESEGGEVGGSNSWSQVL